MTTYTYTKASVDTDLLIAQIKADEAIAQEAASVSVSGAATNNLQISFEEALSAPEKEALDALVAAHDPADGGWYEPVHKKTIYGQKNRKVSEEWYQTCTMVEGAPVLSNLSKKVTYSWTANRVVSVFESARYFKCGLPREGGHQYEVWNNGSEEVERQVE